MDQNGPLEAKMDQNGAFWSILVSRMLKFSSEQGHFDQNGHLDHFVNSAYQMHCKDKWISWSVCKKRGFY